MSANEVSPANAPLARRKPRIPMSTPQLKLSAPDIPGYYCYWVKGTPERLQKADEGGYEFVDASETEITDVALGGDGKTTGSTDLGTRVSVLAGGEEVGSDGQPIRLYLMKLRWEYHEEDLAIQAEHSNSVRRALLAGRVGAEKDEAGDTATRYVDPDRTTRNMFQPKPIRRA